MQISQLLLLASAAVASPLAKRAGQKQFSFPISSGFPNPSDAQLKAIEKQAQGTLPNGALPTSIADDSATVWSLIAANEIFEVAYFTDLISNITNKVPGYEGASDLTLRSLYAIQAQEQLHALGANGILKTAGRPTVAPCKYVFPVNNLKDALAFATTFTDLVLGTLQTALTTFGLDKDTEFLQLVGAVIGQEGEQVGYFRSNAGKVASELPFLTVGNPTFALSALSQLVIVPGSCSSTLNIPVISTPLSVSPMPTGDQTIRFTYPGSKYPGYSLTYINGQNKPVTYPITNADASGGKVTFTTEFTHDDNLFNGLTIAAVTNSNGPFATAADVAKAAVAGPALIEVN